MSIAAQARSWNPWPLSIIAFFAVAITGCVTFVIFCNRHPADLVTPDYYEQEVQYQHKIDTLNRTSPLNSSIAYDTPSRCIMVSVPTQAAGSPLTGKVRLYRASAANLDQELEFRPNAEGIQTISTAGLSAGLWKIQVSWKQAGQDYLLEQNVVIPKLSSSTSGPERKSGT